MIGLDSEVFANLKRDIDISINKLLERMQYYGEDKASISVKLNVSLEHVVDNYGVLLGVRPEFEHKVSTSIKHSSKREGVIADDYLLVNDGDNGFKLIQRAKQTEMNL